MAWQYMHRRRAVCAVPRDRALGHANSGADDGQGAGSQSFSRDRLPRVRQPWDGHHEIEVGLAALVAHRVTPVLLPLADSADITFVGPAVYTVPALKVGVVEPVGAGDAFAAGFLAGLLRSEDPVRALRLGHLTAVSALRGHLGPRPAAPTGPDGGTPGGGRGDVGGEQHVSGRRRQRCGRFSLCHRPQITPLTRTGRAGGTRPPFGLVSLAADEPKGDH
jgi:hypothetical protein